MKNRYLSNGKQGGHPIINSARKPDRKIVLIPLALACIIFIYASNQEFFHTLLTGNVDRIQSMVHGNPLHAYALTFITMLIQHTFTVIPLVLVISINIAFFGFMKGVIWSWITSVIASVLIFFSIRFIFHDKLTKKFNPELITHIEKKGFSYVFQARIFPFVPTSLVNILSGLSSIHFKPFFFGTMFGNFIYFFILGLLPAGLLSSKVNEYVIGAIILSLFVLFYSFKFLYKRKKRQPSNEAKSL